MYKSYGKERKQDMKSAISGWIFRTAKGIEGAAKRGAPRGVTGDTRRGIKAFCKFPTSIVAVNAPHAKFIEGYPKITRRHFHSWEHDYAFRQWARRRGFDTTRDKGGLLTWGYRIPFFGDAIKAIRPKAMMDLRRVKLRA